MADVIQSKNLAELHRWQTERSSPRVAIRYKLHGLYRDMNWNQYLAESLCCGAALVEAGIQPGDRVAILAENRLEWLLADMGLLAAAAVNVPAHVTLSGKQVQDQFAHAEVSWVFVSTREQFDKVQDIRKRIPAVKGIVVFDVIQAEGAIPWYGFLMRGRRALAAGVNKELDKRIARLSGEDLATIMYTSGTTGNSKGVMLTHSNLVSNAISMKEGAGVDDQSISLSWLPYSHIYGRLCDHYIHLAAGGVLCLAESQETLIDNLRETQPTRFNAVPRFYEKVLTGVQSDDPERTKRRLRDVFGSRIEWLNSGGAPLPPPIAQAYRDAGVLMLQGYGLTETSPVITFSTRDRNKLGASGVAVPGVEVKIAPDGEILTRGPHVMKGYWRNPEATAEAIKDGWFHTGDLGELDADGFLNITGRKKDLIVLSNGKKAVPTHIEGLLLADTIFDQVVVFGEGKNFLSALVVPNFENLRVAAKAAGIGESENGKLVQNPAVHALVQKRVEAALADVANFEQVRKFILLPKPFTQEAEEMTVSLKLRRGVIINKYKQELEALYR